MKSSILAPLPVFSLLVASLGVGCASDPNRPGVTNPRQPGPAIGRGIGSAVGAVGGNVVGGVVGIGEGAVAAGSKPFDTTRRVVRTWRTETTADGRTIQVPVDIEVDEYGRPLHVPAAVSQPTVVTNPPGK
jgi:hypothetical protein